ncbi:PssE/Cps14G family polysaccharide biosynthesis glycosyltransferase [Aerococcus urinaeequi]|uniref:PssE/Cps14G family polysaccharide biosynthesis glycosyltransferase n=1 Tax=Aerococcus urinaeequi TaxID=51665 RepID=UPI003B3A158B
MIFITVGSREYPFDRLLKEVDYLLETSGINEKVFAQIGQSTYIPKHFAFKRFISQEEFSKYQDEAHIIISHGGTGSLIGALKKEKKVIAVPRLAKFKEHIDDHQMQVSSVLHEENFLLMVTDIKKLGVAIKELDSNTVQIRKYDKP